MNQHPFFSRAHKSNNTIVSVNDAKIGSNDVIVIAGPCAVESEEQVLQTAEFLKKLGIKIIRASAYKPRTKPDAFQGLGDKGLEILKQVKEKTGLAVETEVMDVRDVAKAAAAVDVLRVGARNMQNYDLLKELGRIDNPVILKNGLAATVDEFLNAAEYVLQGGNPNVVLCWRGIRTFETKTRFALDPAIISVLKKETHLPVIVDPSHPAGKRELVGPLAKAAVAAGADGLLIEVHPQPENALSDTAQQLHFQEFEELLFELKKIAGAVGRKI